MRIALIADTFPPLRTSGAVQLRDLSREFVLQGHALTVMLPAADIDQPWLIEDMDGVRVLRLRAPKTKDMGYVRRTISEFWMPFAMRRNLEKCPLAREQWDGEPAYDDVLRFDGESYSKTYSSAPASRLIWTDKEIVLSSRSSEALLYR